MPHSAINLTDPALDTLLVPFASDALAWPVNGRIRFMRARCNAAIREVASNAWSCEQSFKPAADLLMRAGIELEQSTAEQFALVLLLPPRQRDEARATMARALQRSAPSGIVVASMSNSEGARTGQSDFSRLVDPVSCISKNKCRVFWAAAEPGALNRELIDEWAVLDAPRPIADGRFLSRPGLFAWDRIDPASQLLAEHLPSSLAGKGADLGAGYGYLSDAVLRCCPGVVSLHLYEAEARALDLARLNLAQSETRGYRSPARPEFFWYDVTAGLPHRYDFIVCNPPFHHHGRADSPALGRAFIKAARDVLGPGGQFWLVANRHLPYETALASSFATHRVVIERQGFKVIEAVA